MLITEVSNNRSGVRIVHLAITQAMPNNSFTGAAQFTQQPSTRGARPLQWMFGEIRQPYQLLLSNHQRQSYARLTGTNNCRASGRPYQ